MAAGVRIVVAGVALALASGCAASPKASPIASERSVVAPTPTPAPAVEAVATPEPPHPVTQLCPTALPIAVTVTNRTNASGDLCAVFDRASAQWTSATQLAPGEFALGVELQTARFERHSKCDFAVTLSSHGHALGTFVGGIEIIYTDDEMEHGDPREMRRDCLDGALRSVLTMNVLPIIQHPAAALSPSGVPPYLP